MSLIQVVSTGFNAPTKAICLASVKAQRGVDGLVRHTYVEASEQKPPRGVLENLVATIRPMADRDIVVWLDGDDHLVDAHVLAGVKRLHDGGAWVTYGSFMTYSGQVVPCGPYATNPRTEPWHASHLRTFYAGLFKLIPDRYLRDDAGAYLTLAIDQAVMICLCELAGLYRVRSVQEVRCIYNDQNAWEARATAAQLEQERLAVAYIRAKAPCVDHPIQSYIDPGCAPPW